LLEAWWAGVSGAGVAEAKRRGGCGGGGGEVGVGKRGEGREGGGREGRKEGRTAGAGECVGMKIHK